MWRMLVWFYRIYKDKSWGIDAVLVGFGNVENIYTHWGLTYRPLADGESLRIHVTRYAFSS